VVIEALAVDAIGDQENGLAAGAPPIVKQLGGRKDCVIQSFGGRAAKVCRCGRRRLAHTGSVPGRSSDKWDRASGGRPTGVLCAGQLS